MIEYYISLGSACDAAMILNKMSLRKLSLPFDWLWNHQGGLNNINRIILNDFQDVLKPDVYCEVNHYRFNKKMIVYKHFPTLTHVHTNPYKYAEEHEKLLRRFERFVNLLKTSKKIRFIYYSNYEEVCCNNYELTLESFCEKMLKDAEEFINIVKKKYGTSNLLILLLFQSKIENKQKIKKIIKQSQIPSEKIKLAFSVTRCDDTVCSKSSWIYYWVIAILFKTNMSFWLFLKTCLFLVISFTISCFSKWKNNHSKLHKNTFFEVHE